MNTKQNRLLASSMNDARRILRDARPEDFDGHTSFADLDAVGRIRWASRGAQLILWARRMRSSDGQGGGEDIAQGSALEI